MSTIISALSWVCEQYAKALTVAYSDIPDNTDDEIGTQREDEFLGREQERMAFAIVYF